MSWTGLEFPDEDFKVAIVGMLEQAVANYLEILRQLNERDKNRENLGQKPKIDILKENQMKI